MRNLIVRSGLVLACFCFCSELRAEYPFETENTASSACVGKVQEFHSILSSYMASLPSASSLKRLDVLTPAIESSSAFTPLSTGTHQSKFIARSSNYINAAGTLRIQQAVSASPTSVSVSLSAELSSVSLGVSGTSQNCSEAGFTLGTGFQLSQTSGGVSCYIQIPDSAAFCADTGSNFATMFNAATLNAGSGTVLYGCADGLGSTTDSIGFRTAVIALFSSANLVNFCNLYNP